MATPAEILTQIDAAISANLLAGGPTETWIDDRKVKWDYDQLMNMRNKFQTLANNASRGCAYRVTPMTFGSTR